MSLWNMAIFEATVFRYCFIELRNSGREDERVTLHLQTEPAQNGEHKKKKVTERRKLDISHSFGDVFCAAFNVGVV